MGRPAKATTPRWAERVNGRLRARGYAPEKRKEIIEQMLMGIADADGGRNVWVPNRESTRAWLRRQEMSNG